MMQLSKRFCIFALDTNLTTQNLKRTMRRRKIWLNIAFVAIIIASSFVFAKYIEVDNNDEMIIAFVSFVVAVIALYISLRTFYSIDEVNAISRMDGNVMENPRYRPNIFKEVFCFPQTEFSDTSKALMEHMEGLFRDKSKQSGAHLADNVQEVANLLVLVPYFINTKYEEESFIQRNRIESLLATIKERVENFKEISDGSCKLLEETVNLIDAVFAYQRWTDIEGSDTVKLLEIRGSILVNPVTNMLYYDYLGLYFLRRAKTILSNNQASATLSGFFNSAKKSSHDDKSLALVYCDKAVSAFKQAKENIGDDMIWTAYICFNIARTEYLRQLLNQSFGGTTSGNEWEEYINESIRCWMTANRMIADHLKTKDPSSKSSWLQLAFCSEENYVRLSKVLMQMSITQPLTDYNGNKWLDTYTDLAQTPFFKNIPKEDPIKLTDNLVADFLNQISK